MMVDAKDGGLAQDANEFVALVGAYGHRHDGQSAPPTRVRAFHRCLQVNDIHSRSIYRSFSCSRRYINVPNAIWDDRRGNVNP